MTGVLHSTRAELLRLRLWPALWITVGLEVLLNVVFVYVFNYLAYRGGGGGGLSDGLPPQLLLARMLPVAIPEVLVQGLPMFGGALMLVLGALAAGSGYSWGTVKTIALQGPGRLVTLSGTLAALAVVVVGVVTALLATDVVASLLVATTQSQAVVWPALGEVARSYGAGLLVFGVWTLGGVLIGTLARGPALAVGLGLVWVLVVENLLRGVSLAWSPLDRLTDLLPGTAAGSLAGALGAAPASEPGGTPGVLTSLSGPTALAMLSAYLVLFLGVTAALLRRRDVV